MAIFRFHLKDEADPVTLSVSGKVQILDRFLIVLIATPNNSFNKFVHF